MFWQIGENLHNAIEDSGIGKNLHNAIEDSGIGKNLHNAIEDSGIGENLHNAIENVSNGFKDSGEQIWNNLGYATDSIIEDNKPTFKKIGAAMDIESNNITHNKTLNITQNGDSSIAGDNVEVKQTNTYINNSQNISQATEEIKELLNQLSKEYPDNPVVVGAEVIKKIDNKPNLKSKAINALKEAGSTALEEIIDHPAANIIIAGVKGFIDAS